MASSNISHQDPMKEPYYTHFGNKLILLIAFMACQGFALSYVSDLLAPHESECSFNTTGRALGTC